MRIIWAIVIAASSISVLGGPVAAKQSAMLMAADAEAPSPGSSGVSPANDEAVDRLFAEGQFVYEPPPPPLLNDDPKFHRLGFRYRASETDKSPPSVTPAAGSPLKTATPTAPSKSTLQVAPQPTATPSPAAPSDLLVWGAPTATPFVLADVERPLFHEVNFSLTPGVTRDPWAGLVPLSSTGSTAATPTPAPTPTPALVPVLGSTLDIEDPRFYRGSFKYAPPGAAQAAKPVDSGAPASGYKGASLETLTPGYSGRSILPIAGKAMYYNPGIMDEVYAYRMKLNQVQPCGECVGFVALLRKGDLGRRVWLRWGDGTVEGPFLVIDVAATQHVHMLLSRGWAVDVDYATAMRRGMNRPLPVTVLDSH